MRPLWKTTIVIWSEFNGAGVPLSRLACEAEEGSAYCSRGGSVLISDPEGDEAWDGTEFFELGEEEEPLACILTGAEGENADDCTTHEHERDPECE